MRLVAGNLDLNTDATMTGADGPCGAQACFAADQVADGCSSALLARNRIVLGQLVGADHYDVGHLGLGADGGGLAALGVVGGSDKAEGCTGVTTPVGDFYAVDYVAHEMGHQFGADHTFNGTSDACGGGNRNGPTAVEPGSGSSIMSYAGICGADDLQPHSDPYFSEQSLAQINTYVSGLQPSLAEVQTASLDHFAAGDAFHLSYNGTQNPTAITNGGNYNAITLKSVIQSLTGRTVQSVTGFDGTGPPDATGFQVTFATTGDVAPLSLTSLSPGMTGFAGTTVQGGPVANGGTVTSSADHAPVVTGAPNVTIPVRTPFTLTGSATDADPGGAAALTYTWEQTDPGITPTTLLSNTKPDGPLFRQFGTAAVETDPLTYDSSGENAAGSAPSRTFPDLAQVVAGDTNAATSRCPAGDVACFSEFLPTAAYTPAALHFRLTARDGASPAGGVAFADTTVTLAKTAGPFRVTSQAAPGTAFSGGPLAVTWSVAGTNAAPVSTSQVEILLSTDGGATFPTVLAAATPNDGSATVTLPPVTSGAARIMVRAVGNAFFDVSHADLAIAATPAPIATNDAPSGGVPAQYSDPLGGPVTVSAYDSDSAGSVLTATAAGLPSGLALRVATTGTHTRTWTLGGTDSGAPGGYPVTVRVSDGTHTGTTTFTVVVRPEGAAAGYTGRRHIRAAVGAATARVELRAHVTEAADGSPGGLAGATVTFERSGAVLCGPVPVSGGNAGCRGRLALGAAGVRLVVGGTYAGAASAPVTVRRSRLTPDLSRVQRRIRVPHSGRLRLRIACHHTGRTPHRCRGTLRLRATVGGHRRTIARAHFSVRRHHVRRVRLHLRARARRARLTMTVTNVTPHARATKRIRLRS
jgi:hypothetical protein